MSSLSLSSAKREKQPAVRHLQPLFVSTTAPIRAGAVEGASVCREMNAHIGQMRMELTTLQDDVNEVSCCRLSLLGIDRHALFGAYGMRRALLAAVLIATTHAAVFSGKLIYRSSNDSTYAHVYVTTGK
ncbi:unnamed protein product [Heligmosomoides polygyrus]|uniref:Transmembrane protein n=1 Tax=Heligmosomoides polygyrus TaxID=6339 RepID=A0A183GLU3_HELPZ|nr:unnamed protein product [Heligmosomoides polygyrus]